MASERGRANRLCKKRKTFLPSKNVEPAGDSLYHEKV